MSSMASFRCWAVLLLTMVSLAAVEAGRHIRPAGPPPAANSIRSPETQLSVSVAAGGDGSAVGGTLGAGGGPQQYHQALSPPPPPPPPPHRKSLRGFKAHHHMKREESIYGHRLLVGSSPPTCQGKCGTCNPCSPIHVSIGSPHGALTQQEYYPEVWRCKCGNRLFMP